MSAIAQIEIILKRDDAIVPEHCFGIIDREAAMNPATKYSMYYKDAKWRYAFVSVGYEIRWGLRSRGRTDVPNGNANPFPLGMDMKANSTEAQKKAQARWDLTPLADGSTLDERYWSSAIVQRHELFHVRDWIANFYRPAVGKTSLWVEEQEDKVTLDNLVPAAALAAKAPAFHEHLTVETRKANDDYRKDDGHECRAYEDGRAHYQALVDSIIP